MNQPSPSAPNSGIGTALPGQPVVVQNVSPRPSPWRRVGQLVVVVAVGASLGYIGTKVVQRNTVTPQPQAQVSDAPQTAVAAPGVPSVRPAAAALQAWLVVGEREHGLDQGRIALPTGSVFHLRLHSSVAGELALYAISPTGKASSEPIWSGPLSAGRDLVTPNMRLTDTKGLETLQLRLKPSGGGQPISRELQLWHL